jgi:hypothetical protein
MTRFPMTTSRTVVALTGGTLLIVAVTLAVALGAGPTPEAGLLPGVVAVVVCGAVALSVLWAPRAVRLDGDALAVERLAWSDVRIPLADIASVEPGPPLEAFGGDVWRVAGNGGVMGFTGLFHVRGVGAVRCWATQLGASTVLVRRRTGRPVLLGVDDGRGLLEALRRRLQAP